MMKSSPPPTTMHIMSIYSCNKHKTPQKPSPLSAAAAIITPIDAIAAARVYKKWTGAKKIPWLSLESSNKIIALNNHDDDNTTTTTSSSKSSSSKKTNNALFRLNKDMWQSLIQYLITPEQRETIISFSGKTIYLKNQHPKTLPSNTNNTNRKDLRLMVVFWSPSYLAAYHQDILIEGSSEASIVQFIQRFMSQKKYNINVILNISYILPRWLKKFTNDDNNNKTSKFLKTPPASLAYGIWQLGLRICFLKPNIILSTNADISRLICCTEGLKINNLCNEEGKKIIYNRKNQPSVQPSMKNHENFKKTIQISNIHRIVLSSSTTTTTIIKQKYHLKYSNAYHIRCPHPYLLTRSESNETDKNWFVKTMHDIASIYYTFLCPE